ncbi:MAG: hypothetical protein KGI38_09970 [Thaumarchaeota archaeon]|nr:hypothetical protein [Nitrososphaerota archaeon]
MRRHKGAIAAIVLGVALAFTGAVYVFLWFANTAQSSGLVPPLLGLWTMGNLVTFILYLAFWELLFIGVPIAIAAVAGWMWWKRFPGEMKMEFRWGKRGRSARGGGAGGLVFFIVFAIKVYLDGMWDVPLGTLTLNYVVGAMFTILVWGLVVIGIPGAIVLAWWLNREMKKP